MSAGQADGVQFDHEYTLGELLTPVAVARLQKALTATLGDSWQIRDEKGRIMLGKTTPVSTRSASMPLLLDFEKVGTLIADDLTQGEIAAARYWVEMALDAERRYRMVASLHVEAIQADYQALQIKHRALQESEQKFRDLSTQLEHRVEEQVTLIARAQRKLYLTEKMASVGTLAAGMAHEINNPIGFIRSNICTAMEYFNQMAAALSAYHADSVAEAEQLWDQNKIDLILEDFPGLLSESIDGANRISRIIASLMKYASIDYEASGKFDLNEAVRAVANIMGDQVSAGVAIEIDLQALPLIECDRGRINLMLMSIVQNAVQAISESGKVRIATRLLKNEISITVNDTGCGIPAESLSRIFDPFYTTRDVGKGTGLGLTVCADIASEHGGRIEVKSVVGVGSTFTICLPVSAGASR